MPSPRKETKASAAVASPAAIASSPSAIADLPTFSPEALPERLLSRVEVCELIGRTYPTLWSWMRSGRFPRARDANGRPMWLASEVSNWLATLPVKSFKGEGQDDNRPASLKRGRPINPKQRGGGR